MSIWEYSQARTVARKEGMQSVNESQVLRAITELRDKVEESKEKSKKARRMSQRRREHEKGISPANPAGVNKAAPSSPVAPAQSYAALLDDDVDAFDDIA